MMHLLVAIACMALATATNAASVKSYESTNNERETAPQATTDDLMMSSDGYSTLSELNLPSDESDRIRSAMAKFFVSPSAGLRFGALQSQPPEVRIRTRLAPSSTELQELSQLLGSLENDHEKEQRSIHNQQQQQSTGGGHKSLRNVQPVFMRLPPRFGKRSIF